MKSTFMSTFDFLYSLHQLVGTGVSLEDVEDKYVSKHGCFPIHEHLSVDGDTVNDLRRALQGLPHLLKIKGNTVIAIEPSSTKEDIRATNGRYLENLAVKHKIYAANGGCDLDLPLQAAVVALACGPKPLIDLTEEFIRQRSEFDVLEKDGSHVVQIAASAVKNAKLHKVEPLKDKIADNSPSISMDGDVRGIEEKPDAVPATGVENKGIEEAKTQRERGSLCKMLLKGLVAILRERPLKLDMLQMAFDAKYRSVSREPLQKMGYNSMEDFVRNNLIAKRLIRVDDGLCTLARRTTSPTPVCTPVAARREPVETVRSPTPEVGRREPSTSRTNSADSTPFHSRGRRTTRTSLVSQPVGSSPAASRARELHLESRSPSLEVSKDKQQSTLEENKQKLQQKLKQNREKLLQQKQQKRPSDSSARPNTKQATHDEAPANTKATGSTNKAELQVRFAKEKLKQQQQRQKVSDQGLRDHLRERLTEKKVAVSAPTTPGTDSLEKVVRLKDKLKEQLLVSKARNDGRKTKEDDNLSSGGKGGSPTTSADSASPRSVQLDELCSPGQDGDSSRFQSLKRSRSESLDSESDERPPKERKEENEAFARSVLEIFKWCKRPLTIKELQTHWEDAHSGCYLESYCRSGDSDAIVELITGIPDITYRHVHGAEDLRFVCDKYYEKATVELPHTEFKSKIPVEPDDLQALGGNVSLFSRVHNCAIELTKNHRARKSQGLSHRATKCQPSLVYRYETHPDKEPMIRYTASSPSQAFPKISGMWCSGSIPASEGCGPISEKLAAKLSCALRYAKWLARQKNIRIVSEFSDEEKNRLADINDIELEDPKAPGSQKPAADGGNIVEVFDDLSFCRLLIALHREKRALGLAVGKRSLALCTSKGTFIVRFLLLDPAFKAAFSYALASLVSPKSPRRRSDQPNVKVGGQWEGLGDLIGEVWSDVVEACSSNALDSGESGLNFRTIDVQPGQSLSSQARQVWQVLAVQSETSSSGTTGTSNS